MEQIKCKKIVGGLATGKIIYTNFPINFLTALDKESGVIIDSSHDLFGVSVRNTILIFPCSAGSTVGAYSIFSLKRNNVAPSGIVCTNKVDITTASGCAIAEIPLVQIINQNKKLESMRDFQVTIDSESGVLISKKV